MKLLPNVMIQTRKFIKKTCLKVWKEKNSRSGNVHSSIEHATIKKIPFHKDFVWLRPTKSDVERVGEYTSQIYFDNSYLHEGLKFSEPTVLIDIGANIGLSTLSLTKEFTSIKKVIAVEAEEKNHSLLKANFELWSQKYSDIDWSAINAIATHTEEVSLFKDKSLNDLTGKNSASGTFRYSPPKNQKDNKEAQENVISLHKIFSKIPLNERIIVKIDIEGGEEYLFKSNTDWLQRCLFLTCEVHDRFHPIMLNSSAGMIKALVDNNFAFVPRNDVLHCYNKELNQFDD